LPPVNLEAVDYDLAGAARDYLWVTVENPPEALASGQVMVSEPFAFRRGITRENNKLTLLTESGAHTFEIFGVFYDYSTDQGTVLMNRDTYDQYWDDPYLTALAAFIAEDAPIETVIEAIEAELTDYDVVVQSNRSLRDNVFEVFERTFTITIALRLLATVVAFIGILSALMSLQLEHVREYGVMRATGMTPAQLQGYTFIQTGLMGFVAGLLAIPIGLVLAMVLVYVINVRSFGWTMQFAILYSEIAEAFAVALFAALLAGIYPALQLARINISRAVRSE
jgi:putative ABC transport system permease protein